MDFFLVHGFLFFPAFGLNTEIYKVNLWIESECWKAWTRETPRRYIFHTVKFCKTCYIFSLKLFDLKNVVHNSFQKISTIPAFPLVGNNPRDNPRQISLEALLHQVCIHNSFNICQIMLYRVTFTTYRWIH